jgi:DNA-binding YbaB/EbfC family protein
MFEISSILKKAQELGGKFHEIQDQLNQVKTKGSAAGGLVVVEVNGHQTMLSCKIDPTLFKSGDQELLEELIIAATNEAVSDSRIKQNEILQSFSTADIDTDTESLKDIIDRFLQK